MGSPCAVPWILEGKSRFTGAAGSLRKHASHIHSGPELFSGSLAKVISSWERIGCRVLVCRDTHGFCFLCWEGARTDLRNNEKKLALDMATNAACASLLKKKQATGIVLSHSPRAYVQDFAGFYGKGWVPSSPRMINDSRFQIYHWSSSGLKQNNSIKQTNVKSDRVFHVVIPFVPC